VTSKRISLRDIALEAGVNRATVSRALRNHPSLPKNTCERIQEICRRRGYKVNPLVSDVMSSARNTSSSYLGTLAYLTAWPEPRGWRSSPVDLRHFNGAVEQANRSAYLLEEISFTEGNMTSRRMNQVLKSRNTAGILVAPLAPSNVRKHLTLDWPEFSSIAIGYTLYRPTLNRVASHYSNNLATAMHQLRRLGYRRAGLALPKGTDERLDHNLIASFHIIQERMKRLGAIPPLIFSPSGRDEFKRWMEDHKPDAVLSFGGPALEWLMELRIRVPEQMGFVELNLATPNGTIAGIDQCPEIVSQTAVDQLIAQIYRNERDLPDFPKLTLIEGRWIDGATLLPR